MSDLRFPCPRCGEDVWAPRSLVGGVTTCEHCDRIVDVPGTSDAWVYWLLVGLGAVAAVGGAGLVLAISGSVVAGVVTLVFLGALVALCALAM